MQTTIFYIIIAILVGNYLIDQFINYLNTKHKGASLPAELQGIYDEDAYKKQQAYERETSRLDFITSTFGLFLILGMLFAGGFAWADAFVRQYTDNAILQALLFFGILLFASDIINTPFDIYSTFKVEQKYGFNTTTVKLFILDKIKGWLLGGLIGGGLLAVILWLIGAFGANFWIFAWIVISAFSLFMLMFYSSLIVPLFNKQKPLEDGELKDEINKFSLKAGFKLNNIYVIDGSKRSTKANAYFTGFGAKKRIVLYDTLIKDLSTTEIVGVLAHEIGHYKKRHVITSIFISLAQMGLMLFILGQCVNSPELTAALGVTVPALHIALITFGMLYSPLSSLFGMGMNVLSRRNEFQADSYAAEHYASEPLQSALKKLSQKNLSNLTPHPAYVFYHYSHPPLLERLRNLAKYK